MSSNRAPGFEKHPDYRIETRPIRGHLEIITGGVTICGTKDALELLETNHTGALYVPRDDLIEQYLRASDTQTYCPFKGNAAYWTVETPSKTVQDAFWYYAKPFDEVAILAKYAGVYLDRVDGVILDGNPWPTR